MKYSFIIQARESHKDMEKLDMNLKEYMKAKKEKESKKHEPKRRKQRRTAKSSSNRKS